MNKKVKIGGTITTLNDKMYIASGGQADVFLNSNTIYKIYHNSNEILPLKKIQELSLIKNPSVTIPKDIVYDYSDGKPIGYVMNYVLGDPLLKLFTKTFKADNNINPQMVSELVKQIQLTTHDIHKSQILIVDLNELNIIVNIPNLLTYFIDTDSYQTPSFKSHFLMDSIRDRRVSKMVNGSIVYNPDELSDWFSWGVLTFQLYTNIHPFRGNHSAYKPRDKQRQMDDGISVFHSGVKLPPTVNDFKTWIPKRHLDWFIDTFRDGHRSVPPLADSVMPLTVPAPIVNITGNKEIEITQTDSYSENIRSVIQSMGLNYVITDKKIYCNGKELFDGCNRFKKVLLCPSSDGTMVMATLLNDIVTFTELIRQQVVGSITSKGMIFRNKCIYTVNNGKLVENRFTTTGNRILHRITEIENVSSLTTVMYDGCCLQNLLGRYYLVLPYQEGVGFSKYLPQIDGYRIVDCRAERNVVVIIAEKGGKYDRFVIVFTKKDFTDFNVRKVEDVSYDEINFTTTESGLTLLLANPDELELFVNNSNIQVIQNPPFDSSMKLFNNSDGVFFTNGKSVHRVKRK